MANLSTNQAATTLDLGGDLTVRRLGFGAMRITGPGIWGEPADHDDAIATLRRAVELGVNFVDTADSYGPFVSERLIAEALHPYPEDLVIATKGGMTRSGPGHTGLDGRPQHLRAACDESLQRLRLEQIPLYQFHRPDPKRAVRGLGRHARRAEERGEGPPHRSQQRDGDPNSTRGCGSRRSCRCRTATARPTEAPKRVARPYRTGRAGAVTKMAFGLTAAGAALVSTWGRRRRVGALVGGALVMAGALAERYAVMDAGRASAGDPGATIVPQRQRARARE